MVKIIENGIVHKELPDDDPYANKLILYGEGNYTMNTDFDSKSSNYILAGVDTFATLIDKFIVAYPGYLTHEKVDYFLQNSVDKFLFSYGTALNYKTKKLPKNYSDKMLKLINMFTKPEFMKSTKIFLDSGGFQVSMGALEPKNIPDFIEMYYSFVEEYHDKIGQAFFLDIPPGPGTDTFQSFDQVYQLNHLSYTRAMQMPLEIRNKMIYIHHFRTPQIYAIWKKLLLEDGLGKGYNYYATGGLVAYGASDITIPAILYSIPLSTIVRYVKEQGRDNLRFHVLGGANFIDVVYHKLFCKHIKEHHNIDLQITYDSSSIFKGVFGARYIATFKKDSTLARMSLRSKDLHLRFDGDQTIEEHLYEVLNRIATMYDLKQLSISKEPVYNEEDGLAKQVGIYLMLYVLQLYKDVEDLAEEIVKNLYGLYKAEEVTQFDDAIKKITQMFNQGKLTRKGKSKSVSIYNTLQLLENLDEDYAEHFINKFTFSDDSAKLSDGGTLEF
jgi:hypothetical protein